MSSSSTVVSSDADDYVQRGFTLMEPNPLALRIFTCPVCFYIYNDPIEHISCRFVVCNACLISNKCECPGCRKLVDVSEESKDIKRPFGDFVSELDAMSIRCDTCNMVRGLDTVRFMNQ
jgi:hypothetical protein